MFDKDPPMVPIVVAVVVAVVMCVVVKVVTIVVTVVVVLGEVVSVGLLCWRSVVAVVGVVVLCGVVGVVVLYGVVGVVVLCGVVEVFTSWHVCSASPIVGPGVRELLVTRHLGTLYWRTECASITQLSIISNC